MDKEVIIIGGGVAGLTAAIHLCKIGHRVAVIEKHQYPRHKVCGEYISNEIIPYLKYLGIDFSELSLPKISKFQISTASGRLLKAKLPLGGIGISRFALDNLLYQKAFSCGAEFIFETVTDIQFSEDAFIVSTADGRKYNSNITIGAFGKRSLLDQKLKRKFISQKSPWLAVKAHYQTDFPNDSVALHNFRGGYCGVSQVENEITNVCYLTSYTSFRAYGNVDDFQKNVLHLNPHLDKLFSHAVGLFEKPLTISQISFDHKPAIDDHIVMTGDSAGLIHPLCGNGMAMAIHSAKFASEIISAYLSGKISRDEMEVNYQYAWNTNFKNRIQAGKVLSAMMLKPDISRYLMRGLSHFPFVLPSIIRSTHGKPIMI